MPVKSAAPEWFGSVFGDYKEGLTNEEESA